MAAVANVLATPFAQGTLALLFGVLALGAAIRTAPIPPLARLASEAQLVEAADGTLLTGFLSPDDRWRLRADSSQVDPRYLDMLIAYEDQRFWSHPGIDPLAVARAAGQALRHGRVVSGASTLTMQLVRLLDPRPRGLPAKLAEMLTALKLERNWTKKQILDAYLSVVPFGGNVEGLRAASLLALGKEPRELSAGEAALLIALPQAPEHRRLDRSPRAALVARDRVLVSLSRRGALKSAQGAAGVDPGRLAMRMPHHARHLAERLRAAAPHRGGEPIRTLLDPRLQARLEQLAGRTVAGFETGVNIAVVVVRNADGAVVGYLGAAEGTTKETRSFVDLARGVRSPGSALKPFIYAMAFEELLVHPDTVVADQPIDIAGYRPANADGAFDGDMTIRQALIRSKNTVPVMLIDRLTASAFLSRFRSVGAPLRLGTADSEAGLAVALGGVGISLEQLTWFYSAFANEGELKRLRFSPADAGGSLGNLFAPSAAAAVADILADVPPPAGRARLAARDGTRRIGFKTGTSFGFRDAWAVGFDKLHTVGVWIGRPDGAPHRGAYGVSAAAPVVMDVFESLPVPSAGAASGKTPPGALASPRDLPERLKRFGAPPASDVSRPPEIVFPKPGDQIAGARGQSGAAELPLKVAGGRPPYRWTVLDRDEPETPAAEFRATIPFRGQIAVSVTDADGKVARTSFWLD